MVYPVNEIVLPLIVYDKNYGGVFVILKIALMEQSEGVKVIYGA